MDKGETESHLAESSLWAGAKWRGPFGDEGAK